MSPLVKLYGIWRAHGWAGLAFALHNQVRKLRAHSPKNFVQWHPLFEGKYGLEIGGPSQIFTKRGIFPIYPLLAVLDTCNFSADNVWRLPGSTSARVSELGPEAVPEAGRQFVAEATDLRRIASGSYEFVLASHVLEHVANPLLALREWSRVLKPGGAMVVVVPRKERTFDHRRSTTSFQHLLADFEAGTSEEDLTHLEEILKLHDLARDPQAGDMEAFRARSERNLIYRCLHHHVFDMQVLRLLAEEIDLEIDFIDLLEPAHMALLGRKRI